MKFINQRRADRGLSRLDTDSALRSGAREHARDMAKNDYVGHENSVGEYPSDRINRYNDVSECCTKFHGWDSPGQIAATAIENWMTSKLHRRGLLERGLAKMGVGIWKNGNAVYVVWNSTNASTNKIRNWLTS